MVVANKELYLFQSYNMKNFNVFIVGLTDVCRLDLYSSHR